MFHLQIKFGCNWTSTSKKLNKFYIFPPNLTSDDPWPRYMTFDFINIQWAHSFHSSLCSHLIDFFLSTDFSFLTSFIMLIDFLTWSCYVFVLVSCFPAISATGGPPFCISCVFYLVKERFILSKHWSLLVLYIIVFYPLWMLICTIKPFLTLL